MMDNYGQVVNQASLQHIAQDPPLPGELPRLSQRLERILGGMQMLTAQLGTHADRVHGSGMTGSAQTEKPRPVRSGALGSLEDLIDSMDDQIEHLATQANRNTSLA